MAHIPPIRRIGRLRRTFHPHGQPFPGTWTLTRDSGAKALTRSTAATNIKLRDEALQHRPKCRTEFASQCPFGTGMRIDKRKRLEFFNVSARAKKISPFR
jgi:hypothetical protein